MAGGVRLSDRQTGSELKLVAQPATEEALGRRRLVMGLNVSMTVVPTYL